MTRIAGANPRIWVDIFLDNADAIRDALAEHRRRIEQVEAALEQGDAGFLARWIGEASANRRRMLEREYPDPGALQRLRVHVPDRPGVLAGDHAGARRRADQHRGLRAAPHVARARRHAARCSSRARARRSAPPTLLEGQGYSVVVSRGARGLDEDRARGLARGPLRGPRRQVDLAPRAAPRRRLRRRDARARLGPLRRHRVDARRRARARRRGRASSARTS